MRFLKGVFTLIWAVSVAAVAETDMKPPLTLAEAVALVLENNPQLRSAEYDTLAAAARIRQQSQPTAWRLGVDLDNFAGSGRVRGADILETTLSLARVIELGNKAQRRGDVARVQARLLRNEQDVRRLDVLAETSKRFLHVAHVQAQRQLAEQRVALKQQTLEIVERRFQVGKSPKAEKSRATIGLARAKLALEETDHRLASARRNLTSLWGEVSPVFQQVQADLFQLAPMPDLNTLERQIEQNPALIRFATQRRLADARIQLADASRRPNLEWQAGVRHFNVSDDFGLMMSLSIPLGSRDRAQPRYEEAMALSNREPLLEQDKRLALQLTLFNLLQELIHARDIIEALQRDIIPAAESAVADYSQGYRAGRYSLLELIQAQDILLSARQDALSAAIGFQVNRIEIDRLTAGSITATHDIGVSP